MKVGLTEEMKAGLKEEMKNELKEEMREELKEEMCARKLRYACPFLRRIISVTIPSLKGFSDGIATKTFVADARFSREISKRSWNEARVGHASLKTDSPSVSHGTTFKAVVQPDLTNLPEISRKILRVSDQRMLEYGSRIAPSF
ncbi:hypothetical protein Tco_1458444 [Tanacetum coccineum]